MSADDPRRISRAEERASITQVDKALRRAGETSVTRPRKPAERGSSTSTLAWPLLATLFFAVLVLALVLTRG